MCESCNSYYQLISWSCATSEFKPIIYRNWTLNLWCMHGISNHYYQSVLPVHTARKITEGGSLVPACHNQVYLDVLSSVCLLNNNILISRLFTPRFWLVLPTLFIHKKRSVLKSELMQKQVSVVFNKAS